LLKAFQNEGQRYILAGIAFSTLLCALSVSAPILGFFCFLLLPAPVVFYRIRLGRKPTWIIIFSSLLLTTIFIGEPTADVFFLLGVMGLGYFIGEWIEKGLTAEKVIGYACGQIFAAALFGLIIYGNMSNTGATGVVSDYVGKNFDLTISLYKEMGMPDDNLRTILEAKDNILRILVHIVPGLFTAGLMFTAWMNFLLALATLRRINVPVPSGAPLNTWKAPEQMVWGIIGAFALILVPIELVRIIGLNGLIIFMTVYFFQGIAVVSFYLEKKKIPMLLRVLFFGLIGIQQILALMVIGLGFFDVWINFRRIGINNNHQ
jgi:uncharacterized protein YybS (DUF2232 family)